MPIQKNKPLNEDLIQLSGPYQKLHKLINEIDLITINDWTIMHSLCYICNKYRQKFNSDYILSYQDAPSKSYEYKLCSRIWSMLGAKACEGNKVKEYIDFFYENYNSKNPFRSIGALAKAELVSKFISYKQKALIPSMHTILPDNIKNIIDKFEELQYIKTYGDLVFLYLCYTTNPQDIKPVERDIFIELSSNGIDLSILDKIQ